MTAPALDHLRQLAGFRQTGKDQYQARCPAHEDHEASLSISVKATGKVLLHCFAGCTLEAILDAIGMAARDPATARGGSGVHYPPNNAATLQHSPAGCTLEQYAQAKNLPIAVLKDYGLSEITYQKAPAVKIPYLDTDGQECAVQFRLAPKKEEGADNRFRWRSRSKTLLYGLWRLQTAKDAGYVVIGEGASDAQTLWYHGIPAVGLPGAANWKDSRDAGHLQDLPIIYIVIEPDAGGEGVRKWLETSIIRHRSRLVTLAPFKDPSELYLDNPASFRERFQTALDASIPWQVAADGERLQRNRDAWQKCAELAGCPNILENVAEALTQMGVVGEKRLKKLIYLAICTRFQLRPCQSQ
jgi:putative DNA primase/helicase